MKQEFLYEGLGIVHLTVRRNSRAMSARWRDGKVYMVVPPGVGGQQVLRQLGEWRDELLRLRPQRPVYSHGATLHYPLFDVVLRHDAGAGCSLTTRLLHTAPRRLFEVAGVFDGREDDAELGVMMERVLRNIGNHIVTVDLIYVASDFAARCGLNVRGWRVGHGRNRLGSCSATGVITLSQALGLMSREEQMRTVTHELAHLSHFDHSPAFHARHRELMAEAVRYIETHP